MKLILLGLVVLTLFVSGCTQEPFEPFQIQNQTPEENQTSQEIPDDFLDEALAELDLTEDIVESTTKEFNITAVQWSFVPSTIEVNKDDRVILHVKSVDVIHGIWIPEFGINEMLESNQTVTIDFIADKEGTFQIICSVYCGDGHFDMKAQLIVR